MADNATPAAPDLKVVKDDPGADLLALGASALVKAKEEIRKEVRDEIIKGVVVSVVASYLLVEGAKMPPWLRRLFG